MGQSPIRENRMEMVKKNLFSIICGVIAILAVSALFWPISGLYTNLSSVLQARIDVSGKLDSLTNQQRSMPLLDPNETTAEPLEVFPTQQVIDAGTAATAKVSDQAKKMMDLATQTNQHTPLLAGELPKPSEQDRFVFATQYANTISNYQRWIDMLDATSPPNVTDIQTAKDALKDQIDKQRLIYDAQGNVDPQSQQEALDQYTAESAEVQPTMELERAQKHRIYLLLPPTFNPLPIDPTIKIGFSPDPERIGNAQVVIWVLDDVIKGIAKANEYFSDPATPGGPPQHDILHSAVKQIEGIDSPQPMISPNAGDISGGSGSPVPKVTTVSPSGRVCNALYNAVRFRVRLVVDAEKVPEIVRALEAGQFITVLNVQITEIVDPAIAASNAQAGGFHYGNKPVVRAEFDCEELLMRNWTDNLLPDDQKAGLGKAALGGPTDNGQPQFGPGGPGGPGGPYGPGGPGGPYGGPPGDHP
jgi:hypothetical protein